MPAWPNRQQPLDRSNSAPWRCIAAACNGVPRFYRGNERTDGLVKMRIRNLEDNSEHILILVKPLMQPISAPIPNTTAPLCVTVYITYHSVFCVRLYMVSKKETDEATGSIGWIRFERICNRAFNGHGKDGTKSSYLMGYKKDLKKMETLRIAVCLGILWIEHRRYFQHQPFEFIEQGIVYAIAHIRGGADLGRQWYLDGNWWKENTSPIYWLRRVFSKRKYTSKEHLYAQGGSAGGLLMGAIVIWRLVYGTA